MGAAPCCVQPLAVEDLRYADILQCKSPCQKVGLNGKPVSEEWHPSCASNLDVVEPLEEETKEPAIEVPRPWLLRPLKVKIVSARGLRNADWAPMFNGKSDPFCICEIPGKPLSKLITPVIDDNLDPEWDFEGVLKDYSFGDALSFQVWDEDWGKKNDFLGKAFLESSHFHPDGFDGELPLIEAGKNVHAFLRIRVEAAIREPAPSKAASITSRKLACNESAPEAEKHDANINGGTSSADEKYVPRQQLPPSGNQNRPGDYVWLEDSLHCLATGKAGILKCIDMETKKNLTPLFFVIGACPNSFCGMQAVMFCVDADSKLDFWWVKPSKSDGSKLESNTLSRHYKGTYKNDPGRSKPFYQPLADLFEQGAVVNGWRFGVARVNTKDGTSSVRAFLERTTERLYLNSMWQEDWTSNPFARSKYIKGKLIYQTDLNSVLYFSRQFENHDGAAVISGFEDELGSSTLPPEGVKVLWELGSKSS